MAMQKLSKLRTGKVLVLLLDSSGNNPVIAKRDYESDDESENSRNTKNLENLPKTDKKSSKRA